MAGVILASDGDPRATLPMDSTRIVPGARHPKTKEAKELGRAPASLVGVARLAPERRSLDVLLERVSRSGEGTGPSARESAAAIVTAKLLGWIDYATQ
jgi:hypothetical protein